MDGLQDWLWSLNSYIRIPLIIAGTLLSGAVAYLVAKRVIVALIRRMVKASRRRQGLQGIPSRNKSSHTNRSQTRERRAR